MAAVNDEHIGLLLETQDVARLGWLDTILKRHSSRD
jgi:hypothetical protein